MSRPARFPPSRPLLPASPGLRHWLLVPGSLTENLRAAGQTLQVRRVAQRRDACRGDEACSLGLPGRARVHARDVMLELDGRVVVYARSVTPAGAVRGPWRALLGLGSRPLAELLYTQQGIRRTALRAQRIAPHSTWHRYLRRRIAALPAGAPDSAWQHAAVTEWRQARTLWARHSVFYKAGRPLRVMEIFAPQAALLRQPRGAARRPGQAL